MEILRNFLFEIAGCTSNFTVENREQSCIKEIQEKVDKSKVLVRSHSVCSRVLSGLAVAIKGTLMCLLASGMGGFYVKIRNVRIVIVSP